MTDTQPEAGAQMPSPPAEIRIPQMTRQQFDFCEAHEQIQLLRDHFNVREDYKRTSQSRALEAALVALEAAARLALLDKSKDGVPAEVELVIDTLADLTHWPLYPSPRLVALFELGLRAEA